jgi:hypothetical protein
MKKVLATFLSLALLGTVLAVPLLADPPDNAGQGTKGNEGLLNAVYATYSNNSGGKDWWGNGVVAWLFFNGLPLNFAPPWFAQGGK